MKLRASQETIIDGVFENDAQMIIAGMGSGKTAATLHALNELHNEDVIDCAIVLAPPLVARTVWPKEPGKWPALRDVAVRPGGDARRRAKLLEWLRAPDIVSDIGKLRVLTMSLHLCKWLKDNQHLIPQKCALVVDESSFFKDARSKNGKALRDIADRFVVRYTLTGTPRPNGYEDLWGQYQLLTKNKLWRPFDDWRRANFMPKDYNGYNWEVHSFKARELDAQMAPYTTRVDVDLDLPPLNAGPNFDFEIELPPEARARYDEMEEDLVTSVIRNIRLDVETAATDVVREALIVVALQQAVASAKLAQIAQGYIYDKVIDDDGEARGSAVADLHDQKMRALQEIVDMAGAEPLLIWYGYRHDVVLIERALGQAGLPRLGGGVASAKGQAYIEAFEKGELSVLLAHPASAAHGIDGLQLGGRRHIWFCPTWSAEQYDQAIKRLDRPGQTRPVFSHQIVAKNTVDEIKVNRVAYKLQDQEEWTRLIERVKKEIAR